MEFWDELSGFVQSERRYSLDGNAKAYGVILACAEVLSGIVRCNPVVTPVDASALIVIHAGFADCDSRSCFRVQIGGNGLPFDPRSEAVDAAIFEQPIESRRVGVLAFS